MLTIITVSVVSIIVVLWVLWLTISAITRHYHINTSMNPEDSNGEGLGVRSRTFGYSLFFPDKDERMLVVSSKFIISYNESNPLALKFTFIVLHTGVKVQGYLYRQQFVDILTQMASSSRPDEDIIIADDDNGIETSLPYALSSVRDIIDTYTTDFASLTVIHNVDNSASEPDILVRVNHKEFDALVILPRELIQDFLNEWERVIPMSEIHFVNSSNLDSALDKILAEDA